jgi:hypothetical protein
MARRRKNESNQTAEFVCPECGRTFTRAAALGAHRSRVHGVAGSSSRSRARTRGAAASTRNGSRRSRRSARSDGRTQVQPTQAAAPSIDRDALLQALFPAGIPAKESVLEPLNSWLDEAERLARMR